MAYVPQTSPVNDDAWPAAVMKWAMRISTVALWIFHLMVARTEISDIAAAVAIGIIANLAVVRLSRTAIGGNKATWDLAVAAFVFLSLFGTFLTFGAALLNGPIGALVAQLIWSVLILWGTISLRSRRKRLREERELRILQERVEQQREREANRLTRPTAMGQFTGYEPSALKNHTLRRHPYMFGEPGAGLSSARYERHLIAKGQAGELNFAKALDRAGLLERFASYWSVKMPDIRIGASEKYQGDIDCVVVTGRSIILFDMKNFTQGDVVWRVVQNELRLIDRPTGYDIGPPRQMSRNMSLATERLGDQFARLGVRHQIISRVVFMPTDMGLGQLDGVKWPGGIRAETLVDTLSSLKYEPPFDPFQPGSQKILRVMKWLVKDPSGFTRRPSPPGQSPQPGQVWLPLSNWQPPAPETPVQQHPHVNEPTVGLVTGPSAPLPAESSAQLVTERPAEPVVKANEGLVVCDTCGSRYPADWGVCYQCRFQR